VATLDEMYDAILNGQRGAVPGLVQRALDEGSAPLDIVEGTLRPAMAEVGELFSTGEFFLPQLLLAASGMKLAMEKLRPLLAGDAGLGVQQTVVIGTVEGDLHDIGKNLVIATLEGAGFRAVDLGIDVAIPRFVEAVREHDPAVVAMSALLSTTMVNIPKTISALEAAGLRAGRVLAVGGAPVTQRNADEWGVEAYAADAGTEVRVIVEAVGRVRPAQAAGGAPRAEV
jgi:5-methyltetrahydrofolate--homocysteine methyltransferase